MSPKSLSKEILFGTLASVEQLINQGGNVNEKDAYGLTPLIEATLKEDLKIAQLLLEKGAKIDQEDISGQTALQWAVNRHHLPLCELYLKNKADPNHYSADGQPILVNPLLREQQVLIRLLIEHGANIDFAHDFINAKLIGHRYELTGRAQILNTRNLFIDLNYEGFYLEFTVGIIQQSLLKFMNSEVGKQFGTYKAVLNKIARTLKSASQIIQYKYSINLKNIEINIVLM